MCSYRSRSGRYNSLNSTAASSMCANSPSTPSPVAADTPVAFIVLSDRYVVEW